MQSFGSGGASSTPSSTPELAQEPRRTSLSSWLGHELRKADDLRIKISIGDTVVEEMGELCNTSFYICKNYYLNLWRHVVPCPTKYISVI